MCGVHAFSHSSQVLTVELIAALEGGWFRNQLNISLEELQQLLPYFVWFLMSNKHYAVI